MCADHTSMVLSTQLVSLLPQMRLALSIANRGAFPDWNVSVPVRFLSRSHVFLGYNLIIVIHEPSLKLMIQQFLYIFENPLNHSASLMNISLVVQPRSAISATASIWKYLWISLARRKKVHLLFGAPLIVTERTSILNSYILPAISLNI